MSRKRKKNFASLVEKHVYNQDELHFSSSWCTASYRLAEKQRQIDRLQSKIDNGRAVGQLLEIINAEKFRSFAKFSRHIFKHYPALVPVFLANDRFIRDYIQSDSNDKLNEDIIKSHQDYKDLETRYQGYYEEFQAEMQEKIAFRESQIADLEILLNKLVKRPEHVKEFEDMQKEWSEFESSLDMSPIEFDKLLF